MRTESRFPFLCYQFGKNEDFKEQRSSFFTNPFAVYQQTISELKMSCKKKYCGLIYLLARGCKIDANEERSRLSFDNKDFEDICELTGLPKNESRFSILDHLEMLVGSFVKKEKGILTFQNDFVIDVVSSALGMSFPKQMLRYCPLGFIRRKVIMTERGKKNDKFATCLKCEHIPDLINRLLSEVRNKQLIEVFTLPHLNDFRCKEEMKKQISQFPDDQFLKIFVIPFIQESSSLQSCIQDGIARVTPFDINVVLNSVAQCASEFSKESCEDLLDNGLFETFREISQISLEEKYQSQFKKIRQKMKKQLPNFDLETILNDKEKREKIVSRSFKELTEVAPLGEDWFFELLQRFSTPILHSRCCDSFLPLLEKVVGKCFKDKFGDNENGIMMELVKRTLSVSRPVLKSFQGKKRPVELFTPNLRQEERKLKLKIDLGDTAEFLKVDLLLYSRRLSGLFALECFNHNELFDFMIDRVLLFSEGKQLLRDQQIFFATVMNGSVEHARKVLNILGNEMINDCFEYLNNRVTPLHIACGLLKSNIVKLLLDFRVSVNTKDAYGHTALDLVLYSLKENCTVNRMERGKKIISMLLERKIEITSKTVFGISSLHLASTFINPEILILLLQDSALINFKDNDGKMLLHYAAMSGNEPVINILLKNGANADTVDKNEDSPLLLACQMEHVRCVKLLADHNCNFDVQNSKGYTPLIVAAMKRQPLMLKTLLEKNPDINALDGVKRSALWYAVNCEDTESILVLLNGGANQLQSDNEGENVLHLASRKGNTEIVDILLRNLQNVDICTRSGSTALHLASLHGHDKIVLLLLNKGADINKNSKSGRSPLYLASKTGSVLTVGVLVSNTTIDINCNHQYNPLIIASENGHLRIVELLLQSKADVNYKDFYERSALWYAARKGHVHIVSYLLEHGAFVNDFDKDGTRVLHAAIDSMNFQLCSILLHTEGIDFFVNSNENPVIRASSTGNTEIVQLLFQKMSMIDNYPEHEKGIINLCLIAASSHGRKNCVKMLMSKNCDVNFLNDEGMHPLWLAARNGHEDVVTELLYHGAEVDKYTCFSFFPENFQCMSNSTALYVASSEGHVDIVKILVIFGADVNACSECGTTPICIASSSGHEEVVSFLLENAADINKQNKNGITPLMEASKNGHVSIVNMLLSENADPLIKNVSGKKALDYATDKRQYKISMMLVRNRIKPPDKVKKLFYFKKRRVSHWGSYIKERHINQRLDDLLLLFRLRRVEIKGDGNCFFRALQHQIQGYGFDSMALRNILCRHLSDNMDHYISFLEFGRSENRFQIFKKQIRQMEKNSIWNTELADCLPLAAANEFKRTIRIFSDNLDGPLEIIPDLDTASGDFINLVYITYGKGEHYDAAEEDTKKEIRKPEEMENCEAIENELDNKDQGEDQGEEEIREEEESKVEDEEEDSYEEESKHESSEEDADADDESEEVDDELMKLVQLFDNIFNIKK
ncbi:ankyrin-2-like [Saccostrea cucullata]|uniref:ankyrin-2-like n=1 Tax=Saccostrea cuccullata TaxID=36930 RepID=UPI002ED0967A